MAKVLDKVQSLGGALAVVPPNVMLQVLDIFQCVASSCLKTENASPPGLGTDRSAFGVSFFDSTLSRVPHFTYHVDRKQFFE